MAGPEQPTPEERQDAEQHDVQRYAYRDTDGQLYTIDDRGRRVVAAEGTPALDSEHQRLAEETAALVIMYPTILALNPEQRSAFDQVVGGMGVTQAAQWLRDQTGAGGGDMWDALSELPVFSDINDAREGAENIGHAMTMPFRFVDDMLSAGGDAIDALRGREISRENAIAIGTSFASAAQARSEGSPFLIIRKPVRGYVATMPIR